MVSNSYLLNRINGAFRRIGRLFSSPELIGTPTAPTAADGTNTTQIATTAFVQAALAYVNVARIKGVIDASGNPNYLAADSGDIYVISVAGKLGGASGKSVEVGDMALCIVDGSLAGTEAQRGANWIVAQVNIVGALLAASNLSDLADAGTARTNLGLGTAAAANVEDLPVSTAQQAALDLKAGSGTNTDITSLQGLTNFGLRVLNLDLNKRFTIKPPDNFGANHSLTLDLLDASKTLTIGADASISGVNSGDNAISRTQVADAAYPQDADDYLIAFSSLTAPRTVSLLPAAQWTDKTLIVKDEAGAAGTHAITIDADGAETIDGAATKAININYGSLRLYSNGASIFTL